MKNTKDLEYQIFTCMLLNNKVLDNSVFDEKYFRFKNVLNYFKEVYRKYGAIDTSILITDGKMKNVAETIVELMEYEVSWRNINSYYKQLKEMFRENEIEKINDQLKSKAIDYEQYKQAFYELTLDDYDEEELLKPSNISNSIAVEREYTYIDELDYLLKGLEYGKLNLFSGITNHGKTTLMIQLAKNFIKRHKKVFYFSGEQTATEFKNYLYVGLCDKSQIEFIEDQNNKRIRDVKPLDDIVKYFDDIYQNDFVVYNNDVIQNDIVKMMKVMNKAFNQGTRIFFIDNFMQLDNSEMLEEQTKIIEQFKRFAMKNGCIVNLVAHPRKTMFSKNRLTIFDISGTQNIANKSTNICTIMRTDLLPEAEFEEISKLLLLNNYDIDKCQAVIEVIKTKGNACKMVGLYYDGELKQYMEARKISPEDAERMLMATKKKRRSDTYD